MKIFISHCLAVLLLAISISAQDNSPKLIDEFGKIPLDEFRARVSNLALEIEKNPNSKALVRISGGREDTFAYSYGTGSLVKSVWKLFLRYPLEKLSVQFCNINSEPYSVKFYVMQQNHQVEDCNENFITPTETVLFETAYFDTTNFAVPEIYFDTVENTYPAIEGTEGDYSEYAINALKKVVIDSPGSRIYVICYLDTNFETDDEGNVIARNEKWLDKKYKARKMMRAASKMLIKRGFSASQIVMLNGGYVNITRKVEFWFVPPGGEIPKLKPDYFPTKSRKK